MIDEARVLSMWYEDRMTIAEIAEAMHCSETAVRAIVVRSWATMGGE